MVYYFPHQAFIYSLGFTFFDHRFQVRLTERAPVMRALCVRVAGRRRWYPISGVPLLDGGFNMVSRLALLGALIDALRVFCRPPCGGVDSYAISAAAAILYWLSHARLLQCGVAIYSTRSLFVRTQQNNLFKFLLYSRTRCSTFFSHSCADFI